MDHKILPALSNIYSEQAQHTQNTKHKTQRLMDYVHTYPDAYIRFHASDMILNIDSDAAYLVAPKSRSRLVSYFYLLSKPANTGTPILNSKLPYQSEQSYML